MPVKAEHSGRSSTSWGETEALLSAAAHREDAEHPRPSLKQSQKCYNLLSYHLWCHRADAVVAFIVLPQALKWFTWDVDNYHVCVLKTEQVRAEKLVIVHTWRRWKRENASHAIRVFDFLSATMADFLSFFLNLEQLRSAQSFAHWDSNVCNWGYMESRVGGWFDVWDTSCTPRCRAARSANANSSSTEFSEIQKSWHWSFSVCVAFKKKRLTICQTRARKSIFRGLPVLESCCFSLFLLFFLPCLRRKKQNKKKAKEMKWVGLLTALLTTSRSSSSFGLSQAG